MPPLSTSSSATAMRMTSRFSFAPVRLSSTMLIAAATGTSRETAKSRLRYAVNKLRAALGELK